MSMIKKNLPTLYKLDSLGKVRQWKIEALNSNPPQYIQIHGVKDGKMQNTSTVVKKGKNIGRSNETSAWQQCCLEAESLWNKQKDRKGYTETIPTSKPFRPMLAKSFDKDGRHIKYPAFIQPKLDGIRCLASYDGVNVRLKSRQGKLFTSLAHIEEELYHKVFSVFPDRVLDGELYNHLYKDNFQKLVSSIKRDNPI